MNEINIHNVPAFQRSRSIKSIEKKLNKKNTRVTRSKKKPKKTKKLETDIPVTQELPAQEEYKISTKSVKKRNIREMHACGHCDAYFEKIDVAVINVTSPIRQGDQILFETAKGLFEQPIDSMQRNRKNIRLARSGDEIGLKVGIPPKVGGTVYKII
ncbi:hypothetical protein GF354_03970 [Candidatus Peregrinibacteria bacterium]|nr:hypothetical protein [Candidatus Peregrinibacteria bacterium]